MVSQRVSPQHLDGTSGRRRVAVVLAAGKGTRMRSALPKVLHEVGGRASLTWVLDGARACGCEEIFVVVGPESDAIRASVGDAPDVHWVVQGERRGTGHALQVAAQAVAQAMAESGGSPATGLVLYADAPLVTIATLERLLSVAEAGFGALSVATLEEPGNLGRVRAQAGGQLTGIVEAVDATLEDLEIRQVNAGHYALPFPAIGTFLDALEPANKQGELYLTDAVVSAAAEHRVRCVDLQDPCEAWGINTRADLARVHQAFCDRTVSRLQEAGVTVLRPNTVTIDATVKIEPDVTVHGGVTLLGSTTVCSGTVIHSGAWIKDSSIGESCEIRPYSVLEDTHLGEGCGVGPFARLRSGAELAAGVHIGNFVEVKKSQLGPGVKAGHLAYLGDATVGAGSNIGAGAVTCNYDGERKHQTEIGARAFVGSDSMLVAPVRIGDDAITAAGSVITNDVPDGALGVGRARQRNLDGWADRQRESKRSGKPSDASSVDDQ